MTSIGRLRRLTSFPLVAAVAVTVLVATAAPAWALAAPKLVIDTNFPDPEVIQVGETYYGYSTNSEHGNVPVAAADSVDSGWTIRSDALPNLPAWAEPGYTWAPEVIARGDGSYIMFFTTRDAASGRQCIGTAIADNPLGPFQPVGDSPLICPVVEGGAIDAAGFSENGNNYVLYKNDGNAVGKDTWIYLQPMSSDWLSKAGSPTRLIKQTRPEEQGVVEAPVLVKHGSKYVLFYSAGFYGDSSYHIGYAHSTSLTGPYTKSAEPLLSSGNSTVTGPGGQDIEIEPGQDWIYLHGILSPDPLVRGMYVAQLDWVNDLPVVSSK